MACMYCIEEPEEGRCIRGGCITCCECGRILRPELIIEDWEEAKKAGLIEDYKFDEKAGIISIKPVQPVEWLNIKLKITPPY